MRPVPLASLLPVLLGAALVVPTHAQELAELPAGTELIGHSAARAALSPWMLREASEHPTAGPRQRPAWVLRAPSGPAGWSHVGLALSPVVTGRELSFSVQARGENDELTINAFAYAGEGDEPLQRWSESFLIGPADWTEIGATYVLPAGTTRWTVWVINSGAESRVAAPSLLLGGRARPSLDNLSGPGVLEARARTSVAPGEGSSGTVSFPIPLLGDHQVPLSFDLDVQPPEALAGFRWVARDDGVNWLCEVDVAPPASGATVAWTALVLVDAREDEPLPEVRAVRAPRTARAWSEPTAVVQSDDPGVASVAANLHAEHPELTDFVRAVIGFTRDNQGREGEVFASLDAAAALRCGGSCTSRAQLAAALLRAEGVPARSSAHLPSWSGLLYEHWHVEYWHPGAGWTWVEPTLGVLRPQPYSLVVLNIAWPEDEQQGFDAAITHSGVMPGVPRHAVHEHSPELAVAAAVDGEWLWNRAVVAMALGPDDDRQGLFAAARQAWIGLRRAGLAGELDSEREAAVRAAVDDWDAQALEAALRRHRR